MKIIKKVLFALGILIITFCIIVMGYVYLIYGNTKLIKTNVNHDFIVIEQGTSLKIISSQLEARGLIRYKELYLSYMALVHPKATLKAGTYILEKVDTIKDFTELLIKGRQNYSPVVFMRGTSMKGIFSLLKKKQYVENVVLDKTEKEIAELLDLPTAKDEKNLHPLEGWVLAGSYNYVPGTSDLVILKMSSDRLREQLAATWANRELNIPLKTEYDLLIVASLIEKEAIKKEEMPIIASVFYNRLKKDMFLQTDPTVLYGLIGMYGTKITGEMTRKNTPYNTYLHKGLPPTPIGTPSVESLYAAAHPAKTSFYYFVSDTAGGHKFNTTYQGHQKDVGTYFAWLRAKELKNKELEGNDDDDDDDDE